MVFQGRGGQFRKASNHGDPILGILSMGIHPTDTISRGDLVRRGPIHGVPIHGDLLYRHRWPGRSTEIPSMRIPDPLGTRGDWDTSQGDMGAPKGNRDPGWGQGTQEVMGAHEVPKGT